MKKFPKEYLITKLESEGMRFSSFSLINEGNYACADADWNYKDVPHLHHVHQLVEAYFSLVGDEMIASINMQKVWKFKFPLAVFNYESAENAQTYYTTWFFYALIIETKWEKIETNKTRVTTTYSVGSPRWLKWTFPFIRKALLRNYDDLMSTDIPMRERRGQLRVWGYTFKRDLPRYSFIKTMNVAEANVVPPIANPRCVVNQEINISEVLPSDGEYFVGTDDHLGIRIVRKDDEIKLFTRMCPHEGASLDKQPCDEKGKISCPWHGRLIAPIAKFLLETDMPPQEANGEFYKIALVRGILSISTN